jgi:hypothetical protein
LLSRNEREMALLAEKPEPSSVIVDPFQVFMDFDDEAEDYRPAPDGSNVLVDLTTVVDPVDLER